MAPKIKFKPGTTIEKMLASGKTLAALLKDGDIIDAQEAGVRCGYSDVHIRRLAVAGKLPHFKRGKQFFFYPDVAKSVFHSASVDSK